jgi:hypothetical protein
MTDKNNLSGVLSLYNPEGKTVKNGSSPVLVVKA